MKTDQHADTVLSVLGKTHDATMGRGSRAPLVLASWDRSLRRHGLDPHCIAPPSVVTAAELRHAMTPLEEMLAVATPEVDRLFSRLANAGAILTLNDADGRTLLLRCNASMVAEVSAAGLLLGSIWSEASQGTNGIGICLEEKAAISIETQDHFSSRLVDLSCTAAPIFGSDGAVAAVLNATTSHRGNPQLHALILEVVVATTTRIENIWFERRHAQSHIFRLSRFSDFSDLSLEARLALDSSGRVIDATANASSTLMLGSHKVIGGTSSQIFGLSQSELWSTEGRPAQLQGEDGSPIFFQPCVRPRVSNRAHASVRRIEFSPSASSDLEQPELANLVGRSPALMKQVHVARRLVDRCLPVLIQGETGTGKSALAKALHRQSVHSTGNFVSINCAAIPKELIESELFGHRPGAFTGASRQGAKGRILEADGGTLFLDEIGDMPLELQSRLLHVISDGEIVPIGATTPVKVRFALISASLHDLEVLVRKGQFREDLYFRINGSTLRLPPLRQRPDRSALMEDILREEALLADKPTMQFAPSARRLLARHSWPGNIRELRHLVRFAVTLAEGLEITASDLPERFAALCGDDNMPRSDAEREATDLVLQQTAWNVSLAAERLGISRATLHRKILQFNLKRPSADSAAV